MWSHLSQRLLSNFTNRDEAIKFVRLAVIFAFTIGVYWVINPTKDVVFVHTVGRDYLPYAKIFSIIFLVPLLLLYGQVVDLFSRHRVFYVLCAVYSVICLLFGFLMLHPVIGLANTQVGAWRLLGWFWYAFIESFGSIIVALLWSFASDVSTPESAKRGFSIIALGAQIGGFLGPLLFHRSADAWGPIPFAFIGSAGIVCIGFSIFYFMKVTPESQLVGFHQEPHKVEEKKQVGFFEGLSLIFSHPYLCGIVAIVMLYESVFVIIEFHLKTLASEIYPQVNLLNGFLFKCALYANGIALLCLVLGAGAVGRWLGLRRTLLLLPFLVLIGVGVLAFHFTLTTVLGVYVAIRGLNYALNQPAKEQLYVPTSRESKYKAKAWIDVFGSRLAKSIGSSVHILRPVLQSQFVMVSSVISCGLVGLWIFSAVFVGKAHAQAVKGDKELC